MRRKFLFLFILWYGWCGGSYVVRAADALESSPTAKVVRQYALTSANDFPLRDPESWRLLGSNDGGKTWVTLDVRTNEIFSERHQRRTFRTANHMSYNLYRLQVDQIRDPTEANAIQLAEIEPLGETEDDFRPTPIFADTITAQGENPPFELCRNLFDGELKTKWLDYAAQSTNHSSWVQWRYTATANVTVKTICELLSLRFKAEEGFPVQMEGHIVGRTGGENIFCFKDDTGYLLAQIPADEINFSPGQKIQLNGKSTLVAGRPNVTQITFTKKTPDTPDHPQLVALDKPMSATNEWEWVKVQGQVKFHSQTSDQTTMELTDGNRRIWVHLLSAQPPDFHKLETAIVQITGLRSSVLNSKGQRMTGTLWVADPTDLKLISPTNHNADESSIITDNALKSSQLITSIAQIRHLSRNELIAAPHVRLRGVVIEALGLFMQQDSDGIELWDNDGQPQLSRNFGDYIEIEGVAHWVTKSGPKVEVSKVQILGPGELPAPAHLSWSEMTSGQAIDRWIELEGVVRSTDGSHLLLMCDGGQIMATIRFASAADVNRLVDTTVRIRGVGVVATDDRAQMKGVQLIVPSLDYVEVLNPAVDTFTLPARPIGNLLLVKSSQDLAHRVKIEGTVTLKQGGRIFLQDSSGSAMIVAEQKVVLSEPPDRVMHWSFWRENSTNQTVQNLADFKIGDQVQAVGFLESGGESPVLTEALIRKSGSGQTIKPAPTTLEEILTGKPDSSLVSLECLVLGHEMLGNDSILQLETGQKVFQAVLSGHRQAFDDLLPGSRVKITGICQVERSPYAELGKTVTAFKFLLRTPADLIVLERPLWWDFKHTLIVAGGLVFVLILAAVWIRTLHRQVEERTKRLKKEIEEHKITEQQLAEETRRVQAEIQEHMQTEMRLAEKTGLLEKEIEERQRIQDEVERVHRELLMASRLAGMAEVATGVLHNVGNVLNSVNVLASLIVAQVQKSKVSSLAKLAALFGKHRPDLENFITQDAQGKQVPEYMEMLAGHLASEQTWLLEKVKSVTDNIQHIKEIVAVQQSYARLGGVLEEVSLREIIEDSLRMHNEALGRHRIRVVREFEEIPPVTGERHKILQILFNLLANAKSACETADLSQKQIIISLRQIHHDAQISVTDNGIGIPSENLPKIFSQGFTTREDGHGFGLHSSILAAQEMGGSLQAHSDGTGHGATFTLTIPIVTSNAAKITSPDKTLP